MVEIVAYALPWVLLAFCGSQAAIFIGLVLWSLWHEAVKPRRTSAAEIDRVAADIIAGHSDPEEEAFARHEAAWHRSENAERVYWYRVRKAVRRRLLKKP